MKDRIRVVNRLIAVGVGMWRRGATYTILIIVQSEALRAISQDYGDHVTVPTEDKRLLQARRVSQLYQDAARWARELDEELTALNLTHPIENLPSVDDDPGEVDHEDLLDDLTINDLQRHLSKDMKPISIVVIKQLTNKLWGSRRQFFNKDYYVNPDEYLDRRDRTRRMCLRVKQKCDAVLAKMPSPAITKPTPLYPRRRNAVTPPVTNDEEEAPSVTYDRKTPSVTYGEETALAQQLNATALDANMIRVYRRQAGDPNSGFGLLQEKMLAAQKKYNVIMNTNTERTPERSAYLHRRCYSLNGRCKRMYDDLW